MSGNTFNLWVFGDAHVGTDLKNGRASLADALRDSERSQWAFEWDVALDVGDMSGGQSVPEDPEGEEVVRQFGVLRKHPRASGRHLRGQIPRGKKMGDIFYQCRLPEPVSRINQCPEKPAACIQ